jgi:hypothetical protein
VRNRSQRVLDNVIYYDEISVDDFDVYVNNAFASMENEPITYKEATQRPDSKRWYAAIKKEIKSLFDAGTWTLIERVTVPYNHRVLKSKWVYKLKRDETYKAR